MGLASSYSGRYALSCGTAYAILNFCAEWYIFLERVTYGVYNVPDVVRKKDLPGPTGLNFTFRLGACQHEIGQV